MYHQSMHVSHLILEFRRKSAPGSLVKPIAIVNVEANFNFGIGFVYILAFARGRIHTMRLILMLDYRMYEQRQDRHLCKE